MTARRQLTATALAVLVACGFGPLVLLGLLLTAAPRAVPWAVVVPLVIVATTLSPVLVQRLTGGSRLGPVASPLVVTGCVATPAFALGLLLAESPTDAVLWEAFATAVLIASAVAVLLSRRLWEASRLATDGNTRQRPPLSFVAAAALLALYLAAATAILPSLPHRSPTPPHLAAASHPSLDSTTRSVAAPVVVAAPATAPSSLTKEPLL